jgi:hypothetical protein
MSDLEYKKIIADIPRGQFIHWNSNINFVTNTSFPESTDADKRLSSRLERKKGSSDDTSDIPHILVKGDVHFPSERITRQLSDGTMIKYYSFSNNIFHNQPKDIQEYSKFHVEMITDSLVRIKQRYGSQKGAELLTYMMRQLKSTSSTDMKTEYTKKLFDFAEHLQKNRDIPNGLVINNLLNFRIYATQSLSNPSILAKPHPKVDFSSLLLTTAISIAHTPQEYKEKLGKFFIDTLDPRRDITVGRGADYAAQMLTHFPGVFRNNKKAEGVLGLLCS